MYTQSHTDILKTYTYMHIVISTPHTRIYKSVHTYAYINTHIDRESNIHTHTHKQINIHIRTQTHMHTRTYIIVIKTTIQDNESFLRESIGVEKYLEFNIQIMN